MIPVLLAALAVVIAVTCYVAGFAAGVRRTDLKWLRVLMADFDEAGNLEQILERIEREVE